MKENQRVVITKRMLREGLLQLLETNTLDKIHVNELCEKAGINRTTFYRHYETPRDVLKELEMEYIKEAVPYSKPPQNVNDARKRLEYSCTYIYEHADIAKILLRCSTDEDRTLSLQRLYVHFLEIQKSDEGLANVDEATAKCLVAFLGGGAFCLLRQWILEDIPKTPKEIADILYNVTRWPFQEEVSR